MKNLKINRKCLQILTEEIGDEIIKKIDVYCMSVSICTINPLSLDPNRIFGLSDPRVLTLYTKWDTVITVTRKFGCQNRALNQNEIEGKIIVRREWAMEKILRSLQPRTMSKMETSMDRAEAIGEWKKFSRKIITNRQVRKLFRTSKKVLSCAIFDCK